MSRKKKRPNGPTPPARRPRPQGTPAPGGPGLSADTTATLRDALAASGARRVGPGPAGRPPAARPPRPSAPSAPAEPAPTRRVDITSWSCSAVEDVEPQGLGMTHWVDVPEQGEPSLLRVRFVGRRVGDGEPASFTRDLAVGPVPPGVGRVAVTGRATGVPSGEWDVRAVTLDDRGEVDRTAPVAAGRGRTGFGPVVRALAPGVRPYAWPSMVFLGTVVALVVQALLAGERGLARGPLLLVTLLACLVGLLGAKAYYLFTHRGQTSGALAAGMSIQGFVLALVPTLVLGAVVAGQQIGDVLDVTTPGLLLGMAVGRLGCWFGGCCAGRPTASRWGLWSSDRVVGVRRVPVQFFESSMAAVLAVTTAVLVATGLLDRAGMTFAAGIAAYTLGRQVLFPLRDIPRQTRLGRPVTTLLTAATVVGALALDAVG